MAAMMAPTAAPFFFAYGRDTRRPAAVAITVGIYVAVWGSIGVLAGVVMSQVMMPVSLLAGVAAVVFAVVYTVSPWSRRARARCREMCLRAPRGATLRDALVEGATYAGCCIVCCASVMVPVMVLGMSNVLLIGGAAGLLLVYKLTAWQRLVPRASRTR